MTMGDNPACSAGPPICLDWNYEEIPRLPLREFERFKQSRLRVPNIHYLAISPEFRRGILLRAGFEECQIQETEKQVTRIQNQRTMTRLSFPFYRVEVAVRSAGRKFQRSTQSLKASSPSSHSQQKGEEQPVRSASRSSKVRNSMNDRDDDMMTVCTEEDLSELDLDATIRTLVEQNP
jgi:hypothetical protein